MTPTPPVIPHCNNPQGRGGAGAVCGKLQPHPPRPAPHTAMDDLPPLPPIAPGRYRHYKGGEYEVLAVARHSETLAPLVVYRPLYNSTGWWVRPHAMFVGTVEIEGRQQARFEPLD